jgi:hypothetical protein
MQIASTNFRKGRYLFSEIFAFSVGPSDCIDLTGRECASDLSVPLPVTDETLLTCLRNMQGARIYIGLAGEVPSTLIPQY